MLFRSTQNFEMLVPLHSHKLIPIVSSPVTDVPFLVALPTHSMSGSVTSFVDAVRGSLGVGAAPPTHGLGLVALQQS